MAEREGTLWALVGDRARDMYGHCCNSIEYDEETVAVFSSKKKAEQYIKSSRLKSKNQWSRWPIFKVRSLLRHYDRAWVVEYYASVDPPLDPELK